MKVEELLKILETRNNGGFIKIHWVSDLGNKQTAKSKKNGDVIQKDTVTTIRKGIKYTNIKSVKEALIEKGQYTIDPETGKIEVFSKNLPWGNWVSGYEGLLIENKGETYIRFYTTPNNPNSKYLLNGKEVDKDELKKLDIMQNSYWNKSEPTDCLTVKIKNIKEIYQTKEI